MHKMCFSLYFHYLEKLEKIFRKMVFKHHQQQNTSGRGELDVGNFLISASLTESFAELLRKMIMLCSATLLQIYFVF